MTVIVCHLREKAYRKLHYVDDLLFESSPYATHATPSDAGVASEYIDLLLRQLILT